MTYLGEGVAQEVIELSLELSNAQAVLKLRDEATNLGDQGPLNAWKPLC